MSVPITSRDAEFSLTLDERPSSFRGIMHDEAKASCQDQDTSEPKAPRLVQIRSDGAESLSDKANPQARRSLDHGLEEKLPSVGSDHSSIPEASTSTTDLRWAATRTDTVTTASSNGSHHSKEDLLVDPTACLEQVSPSEVEDPPAAAAAAASKDVNTTTTPTPNNSASERRMRVNEELGHGAFNRVNAISFLSLGDSTHSGTTNGEGNQTRPRQQKYVMKRLRRSLKTRFTSSFIRTIHADLEREGTILAQLSHPNIIQLHSCIPYQGSSQFFDSMHGNVDISRSGLSVDCSGHNSQGSPKDVLVLERLFGTVEDKLSMKPSFLGKALSRMPFVSHSDKRRIDMETRQRQIALPVASALTYIHSKRIIFRDLKPENVGFDEAGTVKLFDFGLARELPPDMSDVVTGRRKMTEKTGSYRFMAPEVFKGDPYGLSADVYSFGLFLWQVSSLEKPFGKSKLHELRRNVYYGDHRPKVDERHCGSRVVQWLLPQCWRSSPTERPPMEDVYEALRLELLPPPTDS